MMYSILLLVLNVGNGWEWGNGMIITSDDCDHSWNFPSFSTTKFLLINHARFPFQKAWLMLNWITPPWLIVDHYSQKTQLIHLHLYTQRIGLGEHLQEKPIFNGNIDGFRLRFSRENQSIDIHISIKFNQSIHLSGEKHISLTWIN